MRERAHFGRSAILLKRNLVIIFRRGIVLIHTNAHCLLRDRWPNFYTKVRSDSSQFEDDVDASGDLCDHSIEDLKPSLQILKFPQHNEHIDNARDTIHEHGREIAEAVIAQVLQCPLRRLKRLLGVAEEEEREVGRMFLGWADALHEIGLSISHSSYHKHAASIASNADMPGFEDKYYYGRNPTDSILVNYRNLHKQDTDYVGGFTTFAGAYRVKGDEEHAPEPVGAKYKEAMTDLGGCDCTPVQD